MRAQKRFIIVIFSQNSNEWICLSIQKSIHIILIDMLHTYLITWFLPSLFFQKDMFTSISSAFRIINCPQAFLMFQFRVKEWERKNCGVGKRKTFCGLVKFWRAYFHHWNTHLPQLLLFNIFTTWPKLLWRLISFQHEIILNIVEGLKTTKNSFKKAQILSQLEILKY